MYILLKYLVFFKILQFNCTPIKPTQKINYKQCIGITFKQTHSPLLILYSLILMSIALQLKLLEDKACMISKIGLRLFKVWIYPAMFLLKEQFLQLLLNSVILIHFIYLMVMVKIWQTVLMNNGISSSTEQLVHMNIDKI